MLAGWWRTSRIIIIIIINKSTKNLVNHIVSFGTDFRNMHVKMGRFRYINTEIFNNFFGNKSNIIDNI